MTISNVFYSIVKKNNDKELNTIYVRACVLGLFIVFFVGCSYKSPYKDMVEAVEKGTVKDVKYFFKKLERENKVRGYSDLNPGLICKGFWALGDCFREDNKEHIRILEYLLKKNGGNAPLHYLCSHHTENEFALAKYLLNKGADPKIKNDKGRTPLHYASEISLIKLLLEKGADPNAKDYSGITPLHFAVTKDIKVVKYLIENGADPKVKDNEGITPLFLAISNLYDRRQDYDYGDSYYAEILNLPIVRLMIANGADPDLKNNSGHTARMVAEFRIADRKYSRSTSSYTYTTPSSIKLGDSEKVLRNFTPDGGMYTEGMIQTQYRNGNTIYTATNGKVSSIQVLPEK